MKNTFNLLKFSLLALCFLALSADTYAKKTKDFVKTVKKTFPISKDGQTVVKNIYGNVELKSWDKSEVSITIRIEVQSKNEAAADKIFDRVSFDFANSDSYVSATTVIETENKKWWNTGSGSNGSFKVHYAVFLPKSNSINISNKYGNISLDQLENGGEISLKYGDLEITQIADNLKLYLAYGNGSIENCHNLDANLAYCKFRMNKAEDLLFESKYSGITIEEANSITTTSKYDNYKIGTLDKWINNGKYDHIEIQVAKEVNITTKYTDLEVAQLERTLSLNMSYGGAKVDNLHPSFEKVHLIGRYANFKIHVGNSSSFQFKASGKYAQIHYPDGIEMVRFSKNGSYLDLEGYLGKTNARGSIEADLTYGGLKLY